jgi:AcrR family transcriptional regulator
MAVEERAGGTLAQEQRSVARARILKAARRALAERGLATTIDEVAELAGVGRRTVFRHFATRDKLFAAAIQESLRAYARHIPAAPPGGSEAWLIDLLEATHRANAGNGRIYWELAVLEPELTGELASAAAERKEARTRFAAHVTTTLWQGRGGRGEPPPWLADAVAVHLSGFTTQSLGGDFGRSPDELARVSARVLEACLAAALAD